MADRSNEDWIEALTASGPRQEEALEALRRHLERSALFYVRGRLSGRSDIATEEIDALAADSSQDALLLVLQKLQTFRGEATFLSWAGSFAVRRAMTVLRRRLWQDYSLDRLIDGWQEPASVAIEPGGWTNPQLATQRLAMWAIIKDVVQNDLTARQRTVLNQIVIHGVPTEIVEDNLGVSASALYKMTHDARRKLKAGLARRGYSPQEILQAFSTEG